MKIYHKFGIIFFIFLMLTSCASKKSILEKERQQKINELVSSEEYSNYRDAVKNISANNVNDDLEYVNNFMKENELWDFYNECDLLKIEKIQSDTRVYNFWKARCDFNIARQEIENKFNIEADSLNKILILRRGK